MNWRKNNTNGILLWCLLCAPGLQMLAQQTSLEASVYQGVIWRHTPKLTTQSGEGIAGLELGIRVQTTGRRDWQVWQRYPSLGVSAAVFQLGAGSHGEGYALLPWLNVPVFRAGWLSANFRIGSGLGWISRPYDWWDNPRQNAIGSHWNNITQFRLGAEARLNARTKLLAGGSFTHFSNGGIALPNFGINIMSGWIGATWSPRALQRSDYKTAQSSRKLLTRRWGALVQAGYTAVQIATFDGPKYPIRTGAAALLYRFNQLHRGSVGIDYEMNVSVREWGLHSTLFADKRAARQGATRLAWFVGEEFLFGDIGIQLAVGRYFGKHFNAYTAKKLYSKLAMRYYFPEVFQVPVRAFAGITLKAHAFTAEYMTLNAGLAF